MLTGESPRDLVGGVPYSVMTADGACVRTESLAPNTPVAAGVDVEVASGTASTTGIGAPQHLEIGQGPLTVAGIPLLEMDVTSVGVDQRLFFALSVGPDPAQARVMQNNMMPLRELLPVTAVARTIELPGLAVDVPAGQNLYLTVSPVSDMSFGHGSVRTPGAVLLEELRVHLPIVE